MADPITTLQHGFTLFQAETAQLPLAVQAWMWVMRIVLGASIVFVPRRAAAITFGVMLVTAVSRFYAKGLFPDVPAAHIGAMSHILLWTPLVVYLLFSMRKWRKFAGSQFGESLFERAFGIWRACAIAVIVISLAFDIREAVAMLS